VALPLEGERARVEADGTIVRRSDGERVGEVRLRVQAPGLLVIDALRVDEAHRGYGLGSDAAALVREAAARAGFTLLRAWAPPDRGLAVYFWVRMGLRPLFGEGPEGGLWFERAL